MAVETALLGNAFPFKGTAIPTAEKGGRIQRVMNSSGKTDFK